MYGTDAFGFAVRHHGQPLGNLPALNCKGELKCSRASSQGLESLLRLFLREWPGKGSQCTGNSVVFGSL